MYWNVSRELANEEWEEGGEDEPLDRKESDT